MVPGFAKAIIRLHHTGISEKTNKYTDIIPVVVSKTAQLIACGCLLVLLMVFVILITQCITITTDYIVYLVSLGPYMSDDERRYKIGNQANIGMFNLNKLLQALNPLLDRGQKHL